MTGATEPYHFASQERPGFPGSPFTPSHPLPRSIGYGAIAVLAGIGSTLGNGLVNVNVANIAGDQGLFIAEASVLPAVYVAFTASANLMLVKGRAQFGIPAITQGLLLAYACASLLQLWLPGLATAIVGRAVCGMTAGALISYSVYAWMQALLPGARPLALLIGLGMPQLGNPLARLFPVEVLAMHHWQGLHLCELAIALVLLSVTLALPLPPSERSKAFEPLDLLTFALLLGGMLLVCLVMGEGRVLWWTETPWLGIALTGSVPLFCAAMLIETARTNPLLRFEWIGSLGILRFAAIALLVRFALAEQTYGAVGFLTSSGLYNDQLRDLFAIVSVAMVAGIVVGSLTLSQARLPWQVIFAALIIALGAGLDSLSTDVTRPPQLYVSQALIGFGTTLFIGPAMLYGFIQMFQRGATHLVSFVVLFSVTQNLGGLFGSAVLGTYEVIAARIHTTTLSGHLLAADPQVAARLRGGAIALSDVVTDPASQTGQGGGLLAQAMARQANVLAYNDVFRLVAGLAVATAVYVAWLLILRSLRVQPSASTGAAA